MISFEEYVAEIFDRGTEEYNTLKEAYKLLTTSAPTISAEAKTNMILLDNCKVKLSTIYFMICREISKKKEVFQSNYDTAYTRLVKLGRPSNSAIESEIRVNDPAYSGMLKEVEKLEQVKDLINFYLRAIDSAKQTSIEFLRDSRRID